jgi:hypothetical protein
MSGFRMWTQEIRWISICASVIAAAVTAGCNDGNAMASSATTEATTERQKQPPASRQERAPAMAHVELERLAAHSRQQPDDAALSNAFNPTSWYVPPPPPPPVAAAPEKPLPPPKPTAPPVPFTYLGRYDDSAVLIVMLVKGDQMYTVSEGDTIDNTYRVERIAAGLVELIYLPLNIKQSISTGEAS